MSTPRKPPCSPDLRVLVVVPTLDEAAHIAALVRGLLADLAGFGAARVVVVDGGSRDGTQERVLALAKSSPRVKLLHNPARVQSAAINLAVRCFGHEADVLIRCDAHARYPADFCQRLLRTLAQTGADSVVVPLDSEGSSPIQRAVAWASNSLLGTGGAPHRAGHRSGFVDHGHHAAFRLSTFQRCGGYDESFTHNEDAELDCRQRAFGAKIYLDAGIRVVYHPRSRLAALAAQYFRYGAGRSRTARRHPGSLRLRQLLVPLHLTGLASGLLLSPWLPLLLLWPSLYVACLALASLFFLVRERSLAALWVGAVAAVMHSAWGLGFLIALCSRRERAWRPGVVPSALSGAGGGSS